MLAALLSHTYLWIFGKITGMFIANIFINPVVVIFYIVNIILFSTNLYMLLPKEDKLGIIERRGQESVNSRIMEYLVNFKTVVYLNLFKRQEKEIDFYNKDAYQKYCKREVISSWKWYLNNQLHNLTTIAIFVYGLIQVSNGNLKVGTLATLIIFSISYAEHLGWLMEQMDELIRYVNSLQRWQETFGNIKEDNKLLTPTKGIQFDKLKINNLSVQREDRETLSKVSFDLNKGDKLAVVGFTGSGKSTLLDVILKVIIDYQGEIKLGDIDYKDLKVVDITNVFSIVPQEVQLFRDTVKGNILASRPDYDKSIDDLLKTSCLLDLIKKLPQGLDQPIHEGSTNVSGGERQRIGIARALIEEQPVLVLDEATASLDPKTERDVITNIINKYPDLTVIYITHKYSLLDYFDKILVMNEGRVVEKGSFEELKSKGGLFSDLFEASQV
jgi:subfamily B ATP-binding cassette protein MsbA